MSIDKRKEGETFEAYKARLKRQNKGVKEHLQGVTFWPSAMSGTWYRGMDRVKKLWEKDTE